MVDQPLVVEGRCNPVEAVRDDRINQVLPLLTLVVFLTTIFSVRKGTWFFAFPQLSPISSVDSGLGSVLAHFEEATLCES
jgi:hypothetical protein